MVITRSQRSSGWGDSGGPSVPSVVGEVGESEPRVFRVVVHDR